MTLEKLARITVRVIDRASDLMLELFLLVLLIFGGYSLWDSHQVYQAADAANYTVYRPSEDDTKSFDELRAINPEVIGWLTVIDTPIDYPLTQADNNETYINTNVEGEFTLSGSIFLDYRNSPDFDDFYNIVYGHHMEQKLMFGSLSDFAEKAYFDSHPYGNLFYQGKNHGLEFFALVLTDAYDGRFFHPDLEEEEERESLLEHVFAEAIQKRDLPVTIHDHLVVLSTCTSTITNGRYLLFGKISEDLYLREEPETKRQVIRGTGIDRQIQTLNQIPCWAWILLLAAMCTAVVWIEVKKGRKLPGSE